MTKISVMAKRPNGTGSVYLRGKIWWIKYHIKGKDIRESSKSESKQAALDKLAVRLGDVVSGRFAGLAPERITIRELCALVIEDYEHGRKRSTADVKWRCNASIYPAIGTVRAHEFGLSQVKRYVASRRHSGAADATINRELSIIRRGFALALQNDPPLVNRCPHIPKLEEDNVREGFVEDVQYRALLKHLPTHLRCLLVVGYHVGCRIGELRQIRWSQVDFAAGEIKLAKRQTKGKAARTLPIYGDMREWLVMQKAERDQDWPACDLVFHWNSKPIGSHIKGWAGACTKAGLDGLHFHDLRRSAVRNMERAGMPRKIATAISGHKTEAVYRRYDIVSPQDLRIAAQRMNAYFDGLRAEPEQEKPEEKGKVQ